MSRGLSFYLRPLLRSARSFLTHASKKGNGSKPGSAFGHHAEKLLRGTAVPGATDAFSRRPLSRAYRLFIGPISKGSSGSICHLRKAVGEWPLFAQLRRPLSAQVAAQFAAGGHVMGAVRGECRRRSRGRVLRPGRRESMASEACPVCCLILNVETPARDALVAKPARRLFEACPGGLDGLPHPCDNSMPSPGPTTWPAKRLPAQSRFPTP